MLMDGRIISLTEAGHQETTAGQVQSPEEHLQKNRLYTILLQCVLFFNNNISVQMAV